jgi:hypothetical protein
LKKGFLAGLPARNPKICSSPANFVQAGTNSGILGLQTYFPINSAIYRGDLLG